MPWYKSGTVKTTAGGNVVTGTRTAFVVNARVGDAFRGPDGAWYEVSNIASDTVLSIAPAYQGATVESGNYALAPMQGYVKASADALNSLVREFGKKLANLGALADFSVAPLANGGTGATTAVAAQTNLGLLNRTANLRLYDLGVASPIGNVLSQGLYMGWNGNTLGEANFICNQGAGSGGFTWRTVNSNNSLSGPAMTYSYAGVLTVPGTISGMTTPLSVSQGGTGRGDNRVQILEVGVVSAPAMINAQGMYMGWNGSNGGGEGCFVVNRGGGVGGFSWRTVNDSNSESGPELKYDYPGNLFVPGSAVIGGACQGSADGGNNLGLPSQRWATLHAVTSAINTSDAREKTMLCKMTANEIEAAKALGSEIGTFRFLTAVVAKNGGARQHVGMTVQRCIEVMESFELNATQYAFICYDEWPEIPEVSVDVARGDVYSSNELVAKNVLYSGYESYINDGSVTWQETSRTTMITQEYKSGGNRFGFRTDQLALFIARGQEARLADIEKKLAIINIS